MGSENPDGAGNQQESLSSLERKRWFLAGVVEGEGSVHIALKSHPMRRGGCYAQPEFFVYQHQERVALLEMAQEYFGCGRIRPKPGNPDVLVYSVVSRGDIVERVLPFLDRMLELSTRREDLLLFIAIVLMLEAGIHRTDEGLACIVRLAYAMNMAGKQRRIPLETLLGRILRGHTPDLLEQE
jgi:hypothetical protein